MEDSETLTLLIPIQKWLTFLKYFDAKRGMLQLSGNFTYIEEILFFYNTGHFYFIFLTVRVLYLLKVKRKKEVQELQKSSLSDLCLISKRNICVYT